MGKKYIIGVDGGTQSSKVLIFDLEGNIICQGKEDLQPMSLPAPGVAEHPGDDLWDSLEHGSGPSTAYASSLPHGRRAALRNELRRRLGPSEGSFRLTARAWSVVGHVA